MDPFVPPDREALLTLLKGMVDKESEGEADEPHLCLACGKVASGLHLAACPRCTSVPSQDEQRMLRTLRDAVRFGYQYRDRYEQDFRAGGVHRHYAMVELESVFVYLGLAVVSGVVGGAAYDGLKAACARIVDRFRSAGADTQEAESLLSDEAELRRFAAYVAEYLEGRKPSEPDVARAVFQEEVAHKLGPRVMRNQLEGMSPDEAAEKALAETREERAERPGIDELDPASKKLLELMQHRDGEDED